MQSRGDNGSFYVHRRGPLLLQGAGVSAIERELTVGGSQFPVLGGWARASVPRNPGYLVREGSEFWFFV